jgi:predicted nucleic acid-binding protein
LITYVDTSTLLKRLLTEDGSPRADVIWESADILASAATLVVEARAALAAAQRGGRLTAGDHRTAKAELIELLEEVTFVDITDELIADAADLAETDALRGYDAIHLAAAIAVGATVLTSADAALCDAAEDHGLRVANPLDP